MCRLWSGAKGSSGVVRPRHLLPVCKLPIVWLLAPEQWVLSRLFALPPYHLDVCADVIRPIVVKVQVKVRTLDIAPLRESSPQKALRYGASVLCTPTHPSAIGMSHTCLCLPSYSWYSFTNLGGMEGWVGLDGWLCCETVFLPEGSHPSHY